MEVAAVIVITFIFPAIVTGMIWHWTRTMRKYVNKREQEHSKTYDIMEKVIKTKDSIIEKMKW